MQENNSCMGKISGIPFIKYLDDKPDKPDKREPDPDDQNEETGPPIKEMPTKSNPHWEEILDYIPD